MSMESILLKEVWNQNIILGIIGANIVRLRYNFRLKFEGTTFIKCPWGQICIFDTRFSKISIVVFRGQEHM